MRGVSKRGGVWDSLRSGQDERVLWGNVTML